MFLGLAFIQQSFVDPLFYSMCPVRFPGYKDKWTYFCPKKYIVPRGYLEGYNVLCHHTFCGG